MANARPDKQLQERYLALLTEVITDAKAKAYYSCPELVALLSTVELVPDALRNEPLPDGELMDLLLAYEAKHLSGSPKYSRILLEGPREDGQLGFNW
jgi:hypothetical protein